MLFAVSCAKSELESSVPIEHVKTELGGCNDTEFALKSLKSEINSDTVIISIPKEFVYVFINLHYQCKFAPFETRVENIDDVICMYLIDSCIDISGCYARCTCDYTFDFAFKHQGTINQKYRIILIDPREENPTVISEGVLFQNRFTA